MIPQRIVKNYGVATLEAEIGTMEKMISLTYKDQITASQVGAESGLFLFIAQVTNDPGLQPYLEAYGIEPDLNNLGWVGGEPAELAAMALAAGGATVARTVAGSEFDYTLTQKP